jgi:hypothetical protein
MQTTILRTSINVTANILCVRCGALASCQKLSRHEKIENIIILEFSKQMDCHNLHNKSHMSSKTDQM